MWLGRFFFFFKQKTAYEMRISDWSSDVCSSDLNAKAQPKKIMLDPMPRALLIPGLGLVGVGKTRKDAVIAGDVAEMAVSIITRAEARSEEHTSELQSLMRISYAVFCLKNKTRHSTNTTKHNLHNTTPKHQ